MKQICAAILGLVSVATLLACKQAPPTTTATPAPEAVKKLEPRERLVGHWINETHRPDGTKCIANDYFFRQDSYTTTFRIEPNGRIFRFDWPYRILHSDEQSIIIESAQDGPQSEYIFSDADTMRERTYDEKKRTWREQALMHRVDDKTSP